MKKALFIDRDGTLIVEPPEDFQVDSLAKFRFVPGAVTAMQRIAGLDYELVMATNQDGLGTDSFPEADFWPPHRLLLDTLAGEGVTFDDILIDRSFPEEKLPTRKPGTGMFGKYLDGSYDLSASYVIGDRITDVMLAKNLGARAILMQTPERGAGMLEEAGLSDTAVLVTDSWNDIYAFLRSEERRVTIVRKTAETDISVTVDLDTAQGASIETGIGFFDHMLWQIVHHAGIMLMVRAKGDTFVDEHHTVEDTAIVLGEAIYRALGSKRGIERYGYVLPMDESRALVLIDFSGRISFEWKAAFTREKIGDMPTEMFKHFFKSFCEAARCNLHIEATGENEHHKIEGIFKAFARALKMAVKRDVFKYELPSSKGVL